VNTRSFITTLCWLFASTALAQGIIHPSIGTKAEGGDFKISLVDKKQNYGGSADTRDTDIYSPKSVNIHPSGKKYYVNSLEGASTVVFDAETNKKLKVIHHEFKAKDAALFSEPSEFYRFTHYTNRNVNVFTGKPVESTFSHNGRYLWVPYYRRNFDINAQDPSAVAIIDTRTDSIVRVMETGALPKMVATSHDGRYVVITHWGENTVGFIDISSAKPTDWHHVACVEIDKKLQLNYSLTTPVNRDNGSGNALRGTVFTPDDKYLLVGCMGGNGGIGVIDVENFKCIGKLTGMMSNVRHLAIRGDYLYLSINAAGYVQRMPLDRVLETISHMNGGHTALTGWQNCKVGAGARTIELTPDGRYLFAACNLESTVYVVDTRSFSVITRIAADSYPVGLDVSKDGRFVYTTSQGRKNGGGNCVDIYSIDYPGIEQNAKANTEEINAALADLNGTADEAEEAEEVEAEKTVNRQLSTINRPWMWAAGGGILLLGCGIIAHHRRKH